MTGILTVIKLTLIADTHSKHDVLDELKLFLKHTQAPYDTVMEAENLTEQEILAEAEIVNWLRKNKHNVRMTLTQLRNEYELAKRRRSSS